LDPNHEQPVDRPEPPSSLRLDSWKEIAAFFDRDERTVNRWEKDLGLPVHRMPGRAKGPVYAYADELAAWMATPRRDRATGAIQSLGDPSTGPSESASKVASPASLPGPVLISSNFALKRGSGWGTVAWLRFGGTFALACVLGWVAFHGSGPAPSGTKIGKDFSGRHTSSGVVQASTPPHNPEAEQLYLQGRYYWTKRTPEDLTKAVDYFTQAIVKDPGYSNAYVGLADCYNLLREYTLMPASEAYPRALSAALKAVELDDQSSEAHASVAFASFWGKWDFVTADREFQRAIELDSSNAVAHHWYATFLAMTGRFSESLTEIDRAQALDPASTSILADKGDLLLLGQDVRTQRAYVAPVTIECDVVLENRTASDGSFDLYFLLTGQPLDVVPRQLTKFRIIYNNTGEYGSVDRLEIDRQEGARGFAVWTGPPFKVEAGKVYHVKINVLVAGKLSISVNGVAFDIPDTVALPYRSFQVQLGGWQPGNRWRVRNFVVH